jgi:hypothetical protein
MYRYKKGAMGLSNLTTLLQLQRIASIKRYEKKMDFDGLKGPAKKYLSPASGYYTAPVFA